MVLRQRIVTFGIPMLATGTIVTAALLHRAKPAPTPEPTCIDVKPDGLRPVNSIPAIETGVRDKHQVDVVFAVDTTGSMNNLIDGAKRTVWGIANHIRETDPNADVRVGLIAYRDNDPKAAPEHQDEYVTRPFPLTSDLDAVFAELSTYTAAGGNDTPENVDAALYDATKMPWRANATKMLFVVGDAPPASRGDVPVFSQSVAALVTGGVIVNAIQVGTMHDTEEPFRRIAALGHGEYTTTAQNGGVEQIATPYDAELAELEGRLSSTAVIVGESARVEYAKKMEAVEAAPAATKADRAAYYAKTGAAKGHAGRVPADIVDKASAAGSAAGSLAGVDPSDLPTEWRGRDRAANEAELERLVAQRKLLQGQIAEVAAKRDQFLKSRARGAGGFDARVEAVVEKEMK